MATEPKKSAIQYTRTWYDDGLEQGVQQGMLQMLHTQLEERFGPLSESLRQKLETMPAEKLLQLGQAILKADSLQALGLED